MVQSILNAFRNRGGDSHEFGVMPRLVGGDSQIQVISLLMRNYHKKNLKIQQKTDL